MSENNANPERPIFDARNAEWYAMTAEVIEAKMEEVVDTTDSEDTSAMDAWVEEYMAAVNPASPVNDLGPVLRQLPDALQTTVKGTDFVDLAKSIGILARAVRYLCAKEVDRERQQSSIVTPGEM